MLAIAAAAALLAACSSSGLETPNDALNNDGVPDSPFGYVLEDPPPGYELCGVSVPSALSVSADTAAALFVYGDDDADDPYTQPLYAVLSLPAGPLADLDLGEVTEVQVGDDTALLGGLDGLVVSILPAEQGQTLTWRIDDERIVQLVVRGSTDVDLVSLAKSVEIDGGVAQLAAGSLPSGYVELGDVYQLEGQPQFLFALDYRPPESAADQDQMTLLGASGGFASMEAFRFRAVTSERVEINGQPGVAANIGTADQPRQLVSWMADDDLILRVFSLEQSPDAVLAAANSAARVDGDEWDTLKDDFDLQNCLS